MEEYGVGVGHNLRISFGERIRLLQVVIHKSIKDNFKVFDKKMILIMQSKMFSNEVLLLVL